MIYSWKSRTEFGKKINFNSIWGTWFFFFYFLFSTELCQSYITWRFAGYIWASKPTWGDNGGIDTAEEDFQ